jgi:hypothetical protein
MVGREDDVEGLWNKQGPDLQVINEHNLSCLYYELKVVTAKGER